MRGCWPQPNLCATRGANKIAMRVPALPAPAIPITRPWNSAGYQRPAARGIVLFGFNRLRRFRGRVILGSSLPKGRFQSTEKELSERWTLKNRRNTGRRLRSDLLPLILRVEKLSIFRMCIVENSQGFLSSPAEVCKRRPLLPPQSSGTELVLFRKPRLVVPFSLSLLTVVPRNAVR